MKNKAFYVQIPLCNESKENLSNEQEKLNITICFLLEKILIFQQPGMMAVRPMGMQPSMGMQQPMGIQQPMGMQQPMMYGMQPGMGSMMSQPRPPAQTNQDPFGAL